MDSDIVDGFANRFGGPPPTHLVRAPGRVNLIGEHTDYNGLPVFPMAIQRAVRIVLRPREDGRVRLANLDPRYEPREIALSAGIRPLSGGDWGNYVEAAAQELSVRLSLRRGFDGLVAGDIPSAAGLSSSSALLVAAALALLAANGRELDRTELMALCARAERHVGTQSGGMDQAICLGGRSGHAVVIEFEPLRLRPTPIPADWRFVIANTFVEARKSGAAQAAYNARVRECREALRVLGASDPGRDLVGRTPAFPDLVARIPEGTLLEVAESVLDGTLRRRYRHVVSEAFRVEASRGAMLEGDLAGFGRAMDASHASLRDDYEASCPELDRLVDLARENGAAGARLTGAGFGGCAVALCRAHRLEMLLAGIERGLHGTRDHPVAFVAEPSDGARVREL